MFDFALNLESLVLDSLPSRVIGELALGTLRSRFSNSSRSRVSYLSVVNKKLLMKADLVKIGKIEIGCKVGNFL